MSLKRLASEKPDLPIEVFGILFKLENENRCIQGNLAMTGQEVGENPVFDYQDSRSLFKYPFGYVFPNPRIASA